MAYPNQQYNNNVEGGDDDTPRTSKYNSGIAQIYRLDALWKDSNKHSRAGQYNKWNLDLDNLWRELAKDIDEKKYGDKKKIFDGFETRLATQGTFNDNGKKGWEDMKDEDTKKRNQQYEILNEKELFLRRLENEVGKGTAWDNGDEDDFE
jgi:hypothetical protein